MTAMQTKPVGVFPAERTSASRRRLLAVVGILALVVGLGSIAGGVVGAVYTWSQAEAQNIVTPDDASIPETAVRGPFTMFSELDIITHHQLDSTGGLYYAEMPRQIPEVDSVATEIISLHAAAASRNMRISSTKLRFRQWRRQTIARR